MLPFTTKKRVTHPFDDQARARLVGVDHRTLSSGAGDSDGAGENLSYLVHSFLEEDSNSGEDSSIHDSYWDDRVDSDDDSLDSVSDSPGLAISHNATADPYASSLIAHVSEALESFAFLRERNAALLRQSVAAFLRERRHDAAVCDTAGDGGGSHQFVDVVRSGEATRRYFVDLDFRAQFEIARPTRRFSAALASVPAVFVGSAEELKRSVSTVCDAARRCFRSRGLPVPPWRKNRFMQRKWFGPCRRAANPVHRAVNSGVSCRLVGFDDVVLESGVVVRTR